ncbi:hypothetical protein RSOLAG1IB_07601 [Rhizoctonia solani AG-1 IB]|uniref:ABM domain-containing protein n=1 Tax=Thanatephorus cucumeris (strain AG1-IB / isolate 7/3/14) TaxID=1108050 RepID=A0A0B7FIU4_THACB|nr:hypothetical protein RSOLAG1IB_07601 [Rhizoctonia solani AG-1 IB]
MAESFEHFTGKVITHALFTVEEGHADEVAKALKSVQEYAQSDKEPGCLTYRVNRSGNHFFMFEEYTNAAAIKEHRTTPPYVALGELVKSKPVIVPGSRNVSFYEEI